MALTIIHEHYKDLIASDSGTAAANNTDLVTGECYLYRSIALQVTGTFVATVILQVSNDNSNFQAIGLKVVDTTISAVTSLTAAGFFLGKLSGFRYYRLRTSAYVSGTVNVTAILSSQESSI